MIKTSPTNDLAFKKAFASKEHPEVLKGFVEDFFRFTPQEVIIEKPYSIDSFKSAWNEYEKPAKRKTETDITATLVTADFNCEMLVHNELYYTERPLLIACQKYCSNYGSIQTIQQDSGWHDRYSSLIPVYSMSILKYSHFPDNNALHIFDHYDKDNEVPLDKQLLNMGYFELAKTVVKTDNQRHWQRFFLTGEAQNNSPEYIKTAAQIISYINLTEGEKELYNAVEKSTADYDAEIIYAIKEGRALGELTMLLKMGKTSEEVKAYADENGIPPSVTALAFEEWRSFNDARNNQ